MPISRTARVTLLSLAALLLLLARVTRVRAPAPPRRGRADSGAQALPGGTDLPVPQGDLVTIAPRDGSRSSVRDRALRDRIRAEIVRAWTASATPAPSVAPGAAPPIPARAATLSADFLRARIREDFIPMAHTCYASLLARRPGVEGRVVMEFEVVADGSLGGIVEDARFVTGDAGAADAGVWEGEFLTCMRESLVTVAFLRPEGEGRVTVRYPFSLRADADGGA